MSEFIRLADIRPGTTYMISGFENKESDYAEKLNKMGFTPGTPVALAPVDLLDPQVFNIRGSRIALRKREAGQVLVREVNHAE